MIDSVDQHEGGHHQQREQGLRVVNGGERDLPGEKDSFGERDELEDHAGGHGRQRDPMENVAALGQRQQGIEEADAVAHEGEAQPKYGHDRKIQP